MISMMKRGCALVLALVMMWTLVPQSVLAALNRDVSAGPGYAGASMHETTVDAIALEVSRQLLSGKRKDQNGIHLDAKPMYQESDEVTVMVILDDRTAEPSAVGQIQAMYQQQDAAAQRISAKTLGGRKLQIRNRYTVLLNGFSATVTYGQYLKMRQMDELKSVFLCPTFELIPTTASSNEMIGGGIFNDTEFHGEGMVIAILDTGVDSHHEIFRDAPESPRLTREKIQELLDSRQFQAESIYPNLSASSLYYSEKIPFQFDYGDKDTDGNPGQGEEHGTHVASTAAGNVVDSAAAQGAHGVAPEAQIVNMKVFRASGGASYEDILSALEDCILLGVDVASMSLGSDCGFIDYDSEDAFTQSLLMVFNRVGEAGISMSVAAGNAYSATYGNAFGDRALASNPDYGNVSEPSTYAESLSVAAMANAKTTGPYITVGDREFYYNDGINSQTQTVPYPLRTLGSGSYGYVVAGVGSQTDFQLIPADAIRGKIALVERGGGLYYEEKIRNAKAAGAIAVIVYNNTSGILLMDVGESPIPAAFITQAAGQYMASREDKTLQVAQADKLVAAPTAGMSDFSSWGATPELTLKPEITAPGEGIYAAIPGNQYASMDGTSMAAPHVAGALALVQQALAKSDPNMNAETRKDLADTLLMSTAQIVRDDSGIPASPRKQGAGLVNLTHALTAQGYITVPGQQKPKLELGDDVDKDGKYEMVLTVHNTGSETAYYSILPIVLTDQLTEYSNAAGEKFSLTALTSRELAHTFTTNCPNDRVAVAPNGKTEIQVTVQLTAEEMEQLDKDFVNGAYVEGWIVLKPVTADGSALAEEAIDLNVPFLAFYGDWTKAPIFETEDYTDTLDGSASNAQSYPNTAFLSSGEMTVDTYLGDNNYATVPYYADRNAISPNGDDFMDSLTGVYTGLLRNAKTLKYTIVGEDGTVYYEKEMEYISKSIYSYSYYQIVPAGVDDYSAFDPWYGTSDGYRTLPNDTKATVKIEATLAYDAHGSSNTNCVWEFPITVDTEEPTASDLQVIEREGRYYVSLQVTDNQYVAAVVFYNPKNADMVYGMQGFGEMTPGAVSSLKEYDVTGMGESFSMLVHDYAGNSKVYEINVPGNTDDYAPIKPKPENVILEEKFASGIPETWQIVRGDDSASRNGWYWVGEGCAEIEGDPDFRQDEWLITAPIDISGGTTEKHVIFDFNTNYWFTTQYRHANLTVKASEDGEIWEDLWNLWEDGGAFVSWVDTQARVTIPEKWQQCKTLRLAFVYSGQDGPMLDVDDVCVYRDAAEDYITVTATADEGGTVSPAGEILVKKGTSKTVTVTAEEGYVIDRVTVDGVNMGAIAYYTFERVGEDHTLHATFRKSGSGESSEPSVLFDNDFNDKAAFPGDGWVVMSTNTDTDHQWYSGRNTYMAPSDASDLQALIAFDEYEDSGWGGWRAGLHPMDTGAKQNEYLISPEVDLTGEDAVLRFKYMFARAAVKLSGDYNFRAVITKDVLTIPETHRITDATAWDAQWTVIWDAKDQDVEITAYPVGEVEIEIPAEYRTEHVRIAFRYDKTRYTGGGPAGVDNVTLTTKGGGGSVTPPSGETAVFDNDFTDKDAFPGNGWTVKSTSTRTGGLYTKYTWFSGSNTRLGTAPSAMVNLDAMVYDVWTDDSYYGDPQDEFLISPKLEAALDGNAVLSFDCLFDTDYSGCSLTLVATADAGDSVDWTELWSASNQSAAQHVEITLDSQWRQAGVRFAFRFKSAGGYNTADKEAYVGVDNVKLTAEGAVTPPETQETFTVLTSAGEGGSITLDPEGGVYEAGQTVRLTFVPEDRYVLDRVQINGASVTVTENCYTIADIDQSYYVEATFRKLPDPYQIMFNNDFEDNEFPGRGWTVQGLNHGEGTWRQYTYGNWTSNKTKHAYISDSWRDHYSAQDEYLVSPVVNLRGCESITLTFGFAYGTGMLRSGSFEGTVVITTDGGKTWDTLWNLSSTLDIPQTGYSTVGDAEIEIPAKYAVENVQIAFRMRRLAQDSVAWSVDNVELRATGSEVEATHRIVASVDGTGGYISPDGEVTVHDGGSQTFTISADSGYVLEDVYVDGVAVGAVGTYTFEDVTSDHTISASFRRIVEEGVQFENDFEGVPFPYHGWRVEGIASGDGTWRQFHNAVLWDENPTMQAYISNVIAAQDEYLISPVVNLSGSKQITVEFDYAFGDYGVYNRNFTLTLVVSTDGEHWETIWDVQEDRPSDNEWYTVGHAEVEVPERYATEDVRFAFHFVKQSNGDTCQFALDNVKLSTSKTPAVYNEFTITASANEGGTVSPSGEVTVREGRNMTFTITPDEGFVISAVLVDGVNVGNSSTYTFEKVDQDHTIQVVFRTAPGAPLLNNTFDQSEFPGRSWTLESQNGRGRDYTWHRGYLASLNDTPLALIFADNYNAEVEGSGKKQDERLVSPKVDLTGVKDTYLTFDYAFGYEAMKLNQMKLTVEITKDGTNWTVLWDASDVLAETGALDQTGEGVKVVIPEAFKTADVQICFHYVKEAVDPAVDTESPKADHVAIDNVRLEVDDPCADGHKLQKVEAVPPTCTDKGTKEHWVCEVCHAVFEHETDSEPLEDLSVLDIPATGHSWGTPTFTWSDDMTTAKAHFVCENDGAHTTDVDATISEEVVSTVGCETDGVVRRTATVTWDDQTYTETKEVKVASATGHSWGTPTFTWSDDMTTAKAHFVCEHDGAHTTDVDATISEEVVSEVGCETDGVVRRTATVTWNDQTYTETKEVKVASATGHSWGTPTFTWSDDMTTAKAHFVCEHDGAHTTDVDATISEEVVSEVGCETDGVVRRTATVTWNDQTYTETKEVKVASATGHHYVDGKCDVCGAEDPNTKPPVPPTGDSADLLIWFAVAAGALLLEVALRNPSRNPSRRKRRT